MHEIESTVIRYIRNVARRRRKDPDQVRAMEKHQGDAWRVQNNFKKSEKLRLEIAKKNEKMIAARDRPRFRVGKQPMVRSEKPTKKKEEKKVIVDPETLARQMYLGNLEEFDAPATK